jgi:hypothetical protein
MEFNSAFEGLRSFANVDPTYTAKTLVFVGCDYRILNICPVTKVTPN